jgi:hypothetical protein
MKYTRELHDALLAATKARATADDDLACAICEIEGGDALVEGTPERMEIFSWVWRRNRPGRS